MTPTTKAGRALLAWLGHCENYTRSDCRGNGRGPRDSIYTAERWCAPCEVRDRLTAIEQAARADEAEALRAALERMRVSLDRALLQWAMHSDEARINDPDAHGAYPIHKANDIEAQLYREGVAVARAALATPAAPVAASKHWHHRCDVPACNCGTCHDCGQEVPEYDFQPAPAAPAEDAE